MRIFFFLAFITLFSVNSFGQKVKVEYSKSFGSTKVYLVNHTNRTVEASIKMKTKFNRNSDLLASSFTQIVELSPYERKEIKDEIALRFLSGRKRTFKNPKKIKVKILEKRYL